MAFFELPMLGFNFRHLPYSDDNLKSPVLNDVLVRIKAIVATTIEMNNIQFNN